MSTLNELSVFPARTTFSAFSLTLVF